jgi:hypothetical protein
LWVVDGRKGERWVRLNIVKRTGFRRNQITQEGPPTERALDCKDIYLGFTIKSIQIPFRTKGRGKWRHRGEEVTFMEGKKKGRCIQVCTETSLLLPPQLSDATHAYTFPANPFVTRFTGY